MGNYIITTNGELYHHGVKGMKWGVRKRSQEYLQKKSNMKKAKDAMNYARIDKKNKQSIYSKTFRDGTKIRNQISKSKSDAYDKALNKTAKQSNAADKKYKQAKKDFKQAKKDFKEQKTVDRYKKHGLDYNLDMAVNVRNYGFRAAKRIENRIANKGMSRFKAETIETGRSMVKTGMITIGTIAAIGLASRAANPKYQVMDQAGKVIRNFY